jgi:hypothetical protein
VLLFLHRKRWWRTGALLAVLLAPSIWMLATLPPLLKDVDAYVQVTEPPGMATILHYAPLYCFLARFPLYAGHAVEALRAGLAIPSAELLLEPVLSDTGVFLLVALQHAALAAAVLGLLLAVSARFVVQFCLAVGWTLDPLFYTFAQCVGSETLSMILMLLLATSGLKLVRRGPRAAATQWVGFGVLLTLCILTRHINAVLAALLPIACALSALWWMAVRHWAPDARGVKSSSGRAHAYVWMGAIAVATGLAAIGAANVTLRLCSRAAGFEFHNRTGFTFVWRLEFLGTIAPEQREQLLQEVTTRVRTPEAQRVVSLLRENPPPSEAPWDVMKFIGTARNTLHPGQEPEAEGPFMRAMGEMQRAFLVPPHPLLQQAIAEDFRRSLNTRIPDVVRHLVRSTAFYFRFRETMPKAANLVTFRGTTEQGLLQHLKKHPYLRAWKKLPAGLAIGVVAAGVVALGVLGRRSRRNAAALGCAVALLVVALMMTAANCSLTEYAPRYTLPLWELTIIAGTIVTAALADSVRRRPISQSPA